MKEWAEPAQSVERQLLGKARFIGCTGYLTKDPDHLLVRGRHRESKRVEFWELAATPITKVANRYFESDWA
jgi:hypothetical protein